MSQPTIYDMIIVGAGPSGSTLARKLSLSGWDVLLLDKATFPRYKVCGGGLTGRAARQLDVDFRSIVRDEIKTMEICCNGRYYHPFSKDTPFIYMVMRDEFDMLLLQSAIDAGTTFQPSTRVSKVDMDATGVIVHTDDDSVRGRYIVGADGVNSIVASNLGLMTRKEKQLALEYEVEVSPSVLHRFRGKVSIDYGYPANGYSWIFPKQDHLSVGVIQSGTRDGQALKEKLEAYMNREGIDGRCISQKGFFLSVGGSDTVVARHRAALVGDAAGLVDPFMGEGIYYALRSANILAEELFSSPKEEGANRFASYQKRIEEEILQEMHLFRRAARVFHTMPTQIHKLLIKRPKIAEQAFRVVNGELSFAEYYQRYRGQRIKRALAGFALRLLPR